MNYKSYLQSDHWKKLKERFYRSKRFKNACFICNKKSDKYHLHHKTYKWIGSEHLRNLVALCEKCHTDVHFMNGKKLSNTKSTLNYRVYLLKTKYSKKNMVTKKQNEKILHQQQRGY